MKILWLGNYYSAEGNRQVVLLLKTVEIEIYGKNVGV